jgi:hypothetical protein
MSNGFYTGIRELQGSPESSPTTVEAGIRRPGGGRKKLIELDPTLVQDLH